MEKLCAFNNNNMEAEIGREAWIYDGETDNPLSRTDIDVGGGIVEGSAPIFHFFF